MDKFTRLVENLLKGFAQHGEGSRGGNIIGHTRTGKPVYANSQHESHASFSSHDHADAMNHHFNLWVNTQNKIHGVRQQNPHWHPPKPIHDFLKHHFTQMQMHQSRMGQKEKLEARFKKPMVKSQEVTPFYAAVIVVDNKGENFLLGKRIEDGEWTSPAGGAKINETPKQAAIREAFEEANIVIDERQMQELPMGYAHNYKPVFCYLVRISEEQMQGISIVNDPDKEVKKWEWIPVDGKMPEPMNEKRFSTIVNAKMHMLGLHMAKSYIALDPTEGMTSVNIHEETSDSRIRRSIKQHWESIMADYKPGDEPVRMWVPNNHVLHLVKVDDGIYSGFVKKNEQEAYNSEVENVLVIDKMTMSDLVELMRLKGIIKDEDSFFGQHYGAGMDHFANLIAEQERAYEERMALYSLFPEPQTREQEIVLTKLVDKLFRKSELIKAKALPVGTVRQWGPYKYVKHTEGWVVIGGDHHGKLMGDFKSEPRHADFARHHENSSPKQDEPKESATAPKTDEGAVSAKEDSKPKAEPKAPSAEEAPAKTHEQEIEEHEKQIKELTDKLNTLRNSKKETPKEEPQPEAEQSEEADEESSPDDESGELNEPQNPREEADEEAEEDEESGEYANARQSKISNMGEDVEGSARHKAMDWKGLASAEKDGLAEGMIKRDVLLKISPSGILEKTNKKNFLTALQMQAALQRFPPAPKNGWLDSSWSNKPDDTLRYAEVKDGNTGRTKKIHPAQIESYKDSEIVKKVTVGDLKKEARAEYMEAFEHVKKLASDILQDDSSADKLVENMTKLQKGVVDYVKTQRAKNGPAAANMLVNYVNKTLSPSLRKKNNTVMKDVDDFLNAGMKHHEMSNIADTIDNEELANQAKEVIQGKSISKVFGIKKEGGKKERFTAADLYVGHAERKGPDSGLKDSKAQADFLTKKSGMRAIQWGNSVTDEEREHHLKCASEAFKDLSDILGLPEEMGSFNGRLALAIGARGKGNALAHYEPTTKTINLTRKSGVGSLAHEWGHMLDNVLSEIHRGPGGSPTFVSKEAGSYGFENYSKNKDNPTFKSMNELYTSDVMEKFDSRLRQALRDTKRAGIGIDYDYWSSKEEIFARCFEKYVSHKLAKAGRQNTYLSGVKEHPFWPNAEEMEAMAPHFDKIIDTIKETGDIKKALELFSRTLGM